MILFVEYLIIIDKQSTMGLFTLCKNAARFNEFLSSHQSLHVDKNKISLEKGIPITLSVKTDNVKDKEQRFFYIKFQSD
jgi:hypothetical protein